MRAVFSLITIIFIACVSATVTSFKEIPLNELHGNEELRKPAQCERLRESFDAGDEDVEKNGLKVENTSYGALNQPEVRLS